MSNERNINVLEHIIRYCDEIRQAQEQFGSSLKALQASSIYKNAVAMCILQIGELTTHLTDDFKDNFNKMPWQKIKGMRNIAAHHYGSLDTEILFATVKERIPALRAYCEEILSHYAEDEK